MHAIGNYIMDDRYALGAAPGTWDRIRGWFGSGPTPLVGDQSQGTPDDYAAGGGGHVVSAGGGFTDKIRAALATGFTGRTQGSAPASAGGRTGTAPPASSGGGGVDGGLIAAAGIGLAAFAGFLIFMKYRKGKNRRR